VVTSMAGYPILFLQNAHLVLAFLNALATMRARSEG
jgi:hypothetical protein